MSGLYCAGFDLTPGKFWKLMAGYSKHLIRALEIRLLKRCETEMKSQDRHLGPT